MEHGVKLAPELERAVVRWFGGLLVHGGSGVTLSSDLEIRVNRPLHVGGVVSAMLVQRLRPVRLLVVRMDGRTVEVQTFRCGGVDGSERYLSYCATCGDVMVGEYQDLEDGVYLGCRKCGMEVAAVGIDGPCVAWHTFGSCLRCPAPEAPPMAKAPVGNAGPQSGPAPHAGPANSSQGPVPKVCSSPSSLGGCGCGRCGS